MAKDCFFLALEGLDGAGKTVIVRLLGKELEQRTGALLKTTYEPHDPSFGGKFLRDVLGKKIKTDPYTLALAFAANRAHHNACVIQPFLDADDHQKRILISDRYYLSSLVYQSTGSITIEDVMRINQWARRPDLILFLNVSTEVCYERMNRRHPERELFETRLDETRAKYQQAIAFLRQRGDAVIEIDANPPIPEVLRQIFGALREYGPDWLQLQ